MGWWVHLHDDRGHEEGEWNGTHNINPMVNRALAEAGRALTEREIGGTMFSGTWWKELDGMPGPDGAAFLADAVRIMRADPATYEAMNPRNRWGSYDLILQQLEEMIAAVPEWPSEWSTSG